MAQLAISRTVPHSIDAVWRAWADFGGIERFHPAVEKSRIIGGPSEGTGAIRRCDFYDGSMIEEKLTVFQPMTRIGWEIVSAPGPLKSGEALVTLERRDPAATHIEFVLNFRMKLGPVGVLLGNTVVKAAMKKTLTSLLRGLDDHLRTGRSIGQAGVLGPA